MRTPSLLLALFLLLSGSLAAVTAGQVQGFETSLGTWLGPGVGPPLLWGSNGINGRYMGMANNGDKPVMYDDNSSSIWKGNWSGFVLITMQAYNAGPDTLYLRVCLDGNGGRIASNSSIALPPDGNWRSLSWPISVSDFTLAGGSSVSSTLSSVSMLRLVHNLGSPNFSSDLATATWGVDDIQVHAILPTATISRTPTPSPTASATISNTGTVSPTFSPSPSTSVTPSITLTWSATDSPTPSATPSASPTATASPSVTPTATDSPVHSPTASPTASSSFTDSPTPTASPSASPTASPTASPSATPSVSVTRTPSATPTASPLQSATATPSPTPTVAPALPGVGGIWGPGLVRVGQTLCAWSGAATVEEATLYNVYGEKALAWSGQPCASLGSVAPGVYWLKTRVTGQPATWLKLAVAP